MQNDFRYDQIIRKKIQKEINSIANIQLLKIYYFDDPILKPYEDAIHKIINVNYPISMKFDICIEPAEILNKIYMPYKKQMNNYRWLIPYFDKSLWWVEIKIYNIEHLLKYICKDNLFEILVVDLEHNFIFDSEVCDDEICDENKYLISILDLD